MRPEFTEWTYNPPNWSAEDKKWMKRALVLAVKGFTHPNPRVGCVFAKEGRKLAEGYHKVAGTPHAEAVALAAAKRAGIDTRGATAYVTLEPCCHHGRTPPCADALIEAGVSRVVVSMEDPNPKVSGKGLAKLSDAGIQVDMGLLGAEAAWLNGPFVHYHTTGTPFVTLKIAATLDGKVATASGDSKWITGSEARQFVHHLRGQAGAVLVGVGTAIADDPLLTARIPKIPRQPLRVVLDPKLRLPHNSQLALSAKEIPVLLVHSPDADTALAEALTEKGVETIALPVDESGGFDLHALLKLFADREIISVLVEGGPVTSAAFLRAGCVDQILWFIAPKILGGQDSRSAIAGFNPTTIGDHFPLHGLVTWNMGEDLLIDTLLKRPLEPVTVSYSNE